MAVAVVAEPDIAKGICKKINGKGRRPEICRVVEAGKAR